MALRLENSHGTLIHFNRSCILTNTYVYGGGGGGGGDGGGGCGDGGGVHVCVCVMLCFVVSCLIFEL